MVDRRIQHHCTNNRLCHMPSGTTVRREALSNASPLGVVYWPSWYAEDVVASFPEQPLEVEDQGLFYVCNSNSQQFCQQTPTNHLSWCLIYRQNALGVVAC
jgi:hypothetical protein